MKVTKEEKGITLIALVITIVILLILAEVSVAMLTGDNGILKQTVNAKDSKNKSTAKKKIDIVILNCVNENGTFNIINFEKKLIDSYRLNANNMKQKNNGDVEIALDGYKITVNLNGNIISSDEISSDNINEGYGLRIENGIIKFYGKDNYIYTLVGENGKNNSNWSTSYDFQNRLSYVIRHDGGITCYDADGTAQQSSFEVPLNL